MGPQSAQLPDGRLHLSHGPIDLIIQADGVDEAVELAHLRARERFSTLLSELVLELAALRRPVGVTCPLEGEVARCMWDACFPYRAQFVTPMAAVAGAVAQAIIACYAVPGIARAAVNNGGDIALHLGANASYRVGVCTDVDAATTAAMKGETKTDYSLTVTAQSPVRGIATSGWRGRSFSLGIADSVTVLASTAAQADVAATMIANAVDVDDPRIRRAPACELKDDSDLGRLLVTVDVPPLESEALEHALASGVARAQYLQSMGLIHDAVLVCQGRFVHLNTSSPAQSRAAVAPTSLPAACAASSAPRESNPFESRTARTCP